MFKQDQAIISKYARSSPKNFARVMQFVILTARARIDNIEANFNTAEYGQPDEILGVLFGWKFKAFNEVWINRETHYSFCEDAAQRAESPHELSCVLIEYIAGLHGYGPAKAGFVAQLIYGHLGAGGCLDSHHLKRFKIPSRRFDSYRQIRTVRARRRKIELYVTTTEALGGPETLWDAWCHYVANDQPTAYASAAQVSSLHIEALSITNERKIS